MEESVGREVQLVIASKNNEDENTQKKANISGGNENKNDQLVIEIEKMFERPQIQSLEQCRIYKVPHQLRKWNNEAYTPQVISIGPYHHKKKRLKAMEKHKEIYFRSFEKRSEKKLRYLVGTITEMEESIRGCYEETIDLSSDRFVKMILVDACFILELLVRSSEGFESDDPMAVEPRATAVMLDLLLFENQLPFFLIVKLHHLAFPSLSDNAHPCLSNYHVLVELFIKFYRCLNFRFIQFCPNVKIEHFTDLLRTLLLPPLEKQPKRGSQHIEHLYSAAQLHEAGVKFDIGTSQCCFESFDIKFEKGVLKIPTLKLDDWTEVVTRNIMALEQTRYVQNAYFTDYFILMDSLIDTIEDVDLLCKKNLLINNLGDNNAAKSMINNLNKEITCMTTRVDYIGCCNELNKFYENPWHSRKATLKREYFSTPWRGASTVAAIILLVLTFIQTACSIISLV